MEVKKKEGRMEYWSIGVMEYWKEEKTPAVATLWQGKPVFPSSVVLPQAGRSTGTCRHFIGPKPLAKADPPRAPERGILAKASESHGG